MIIIKKGSIIKDGKGEEYLLNFEAKVEAIQYLDSRMIVKLGDDSYAVYYDNIEFVEDDKKAMREIIIRDVSNTEKEKEKNEVNQ